MEMSTDHVVEQAGRAMAVVGAMGRRSRRRRVDVAQEYIRAADELADASEAFTGGTISDYGLVTLRDVLRVVLNIISFQASRFDGPQGRELRRVKRRLAELFELFSDSVAAREARAEAQQSTRRPVPLERVRRKSR